MRRSIQLATACLWLVCSGCATFAPFEEEPPVPAPRRNPVVARPVGKPQAPIVRKLPQPAPAAVAPPARWVPPPPKPALPAPAGTAAPSRRTIMAVQTFLDRENYSCNCIDGKAGSRTKQAVLAWEAANGLTPTGEITPELLASVGDPARYFAVHIVSAEELAALVDVPVTWAGRAEAASLGFETILETLAEKYHCTEGALRTLNPDAAWPDPPAGTCVNVPNPLPASARRGARVAIQLGVKTVSVYDTEGRLVALFPCSIAAKAEKRPVGDLVIVTAAADPEYLFDPALFAESPEARAMKGKRMIAAGPNNPVGVAWISLDRPGYGIHGTPHPEDIGKTESHGCFRLANWNARRLLNMVTAGTPVRVDP